jgi:hypothetical protein
MWLQLSEFIAIQKCNSLRLLVVRSLLYQPLNRLSLKNILIIRASLLVHYARKYVSRVQDSDEESCTRTYYSSAACAVMPVDFVACCSTWVTALRSHAKHTFACEESEEECPLTKIICFIVNVLLSFVELFTTLVARASLLKAGCQVSWQAVHAQRIARALVGYCGTSIASIDFSPGTLDILGDHKISIAVSLLADSM